MLLINPNETWPLKGKQTEPKQTHLSVSVATQWGERGEWCSQLAQVLQQRFVSELLLSDEIRSYKIRPTPEPIYLNELIVLESSKNEQIAGL